MSNVDRATVDKVTAPTIDRVTTNVDNDARQLVPVFNGEDNNYYDVTKVVPVEANVVLVSPPGDHPRSASDDAAELRDERSLGNTDSSRLMAVDSAPDASSQSTRGPRRHRKRSSVSNNVDVDDVVIDVHSGQHDVLTTGRKTSVGLSHQRHSDAADREHRPKRKGNY